MTFSLIIFTILVLGWFFWEELSDPVNNYFKNKNSLKENVLAAERLARVKALSDDSKEIETFIEKNVKLLSEETMSKLIACLELIKADRDIEGDSIKKRIDALEPYRAIQPDIQFEVATKKSRR